MLNDLIAAVTSAHAALDDHLNTVATLDSGITNSRGDEPGVGLARDIEWATNSRLNFLATKIVESQRWYDISETAYVKALAAKDESNNQGERNAAEVEFASADEDLWKATRYMEVAQARHAPMASEFNRLKNLYKEVTGTGWTQNATKASGGVTVDKTKMAAALKARKAGEEAHLKAVKAEAAANEYVHAEKAN